jgi:tetratricopeptide repeat protein
MDGAAPQDAHWEARVAEAWAALDATHPQDLRARIQALAAQRPDGDAAALFERACAHDSTGEPAAAEPLYRAALTAGLSGPRRRRAVIQLSSTLRNLGRAPEALDLLTAERESGVSDGLDDALTAVLALTLSALGRDREALGLTVTALARHLPRYNRSMANYGRDLVEQARAAAG